jgi:hypothetical protein
MARGWGQLVGRQVQPGDWGQVEDEAPNRPEYARVHVVFK